MHPPVHYAFLFRISLTAALGGLLFGYDTAVIAGTVEFLQAHFELTDIMLGWTVSSALLGCILGSAGAGWLGDKLGRRLTMFICAALFLLSALWSAFAQSPGELVIARILGGIGVGAASLLTPVYISEIAPARYRGALTTLNQIAILVGMVIVYLVNAQLAGAGDSAWREAVAWRWMFGSEALPALAFFLLLFTIPESPRWLALRGKTEAAKAIFNEIGGDEAPEDLVRSITAAEQQQKVSPAALFRPPYRIILLTGIVLAVLQQATGINIVMYYAPRIFTSAGVDVVSAVGHSVVIGLTMLFFTQFAFFLADRAGRRPLLLISSAGMTISLLALGFSFGGEATANPTLLLVWIIIYVASFSIGMGPLVWTVIAEIFPNAIRARAVSICVLLLWTANFLVSQFFPYLLSTFGPYTFWLYGAFGAIAVVFISLRVSETKGKTLETITSEEIRSA